MIGYSRRYKTVLCGWLFLVIFCFFSQISQDVETTQKQKEKDQVEVIFFQSGNKHRYVVNIPYFSTDCLTKTNQTKPFEMNLCCGNILWSA